MPHPHWFALHPNVTVEHLGILPIFLDSDDKRGAAEQMDANYGFGGFKQHPMNFRKGDVQYSLEYPGDPTLLPIAFATLRDEVICLYDAEIVAVWQPDGSFVAARFD